MTMKEFHEAMSELIDATNVFVEEVLHEPTLEARNVMFHRDRLLDCLEEWHEASKAASDHAGDP